MTQAAKSVAELAKLCVPAAMIFADHEDHIADARQRAEKHITAFLKEHYPTKVSE